MKFLLPLLLLSPMTWGKPTETTESLIPTVVIQSQSSQDHSPINPFAVFKSEKVPKEKLRSPVRQSLAEVVADQVGIDNQTYCANCGAKRLRINGLKGEHTSILIDGLPLHSTISSFYGVDNIPVNGIENILVMRGAGASLTNPEAIGGTINIQTVDPLRAGSHYLTSLGVDDSSTMKSQNHQALYTHRGDSERWGLSLGGQWAQMEPWDEDHNRVTESPQRQNFATMAKARLLLGSKHDLSLRLGSSQLEILGGVVNPRKPHRVQPPVNGSDFINGSVEESFIGNPLAITDWIKLQRNETALMGTHYLSQTSPLNGSWATPDRSKAPFINMVLTMPISIISGWEMHRSNTLLKTTIFSHGVSFLKIKE